MADNDKPTSKGGRPTRYTKKISKEICFRLAEGESLSSICKSEHIPHRSNILRWVLSKSTTYAGFRDDYILARQIQAETLVDDIFDIADDGSNDWMESNHPDNKGFTVNGEALGRSRLRVDTRKWHASKIITRYKDDYKGESDASTLAEALNNLADSLPS